MLNNQLNATRHHTSTSLTMRKHLTAWIGLHGDFDTIVYLRSSISGGTHSTDYNAKSCIKESCILSQDRCRTRLFTLPLSSGG
ncbi:unnamed protein product [Schistosoma margrebowiei]|uniref:Uncharacterized protein n=1 Tax=Schistosoma margrebowiei TaxID=48269 RepID=A0A3P8CE56_9TREM|nr:unnamed protein product [Schistosoma margrebowiei]